MLSAKGSKSALRKPFSCLSRTCCLPQVSTFTVVTSLATLCSVGIAEYSRPNEIVLCAAALMSEVYDDHKDEDGFLYITYSGENTFG